MKIQNRTFSSEQEIQAVIEKLLEKESEFSTPRAQKAFVAKLTRYHRLLQAFRDGHPDKWRDYSIADRHAAYSSLAELYLGQPQ